MLGQLQGAPLEGRALGGVDFLGHLRLPFELGEIAGELEEAETDAGHAVAGLEASCRKRRVNGAS